jgi:hypothetical protein
VGPGPALALLLAGLIVMLSGAGCSSSRARPSGTGSSEREARVHELDSIQDLRARFGRDAGKVRLLLLISPT